MKVLITGASGFVGKNLAAMLGERKDVELLLAGRATPEATLRGYFEETDFVYHLAGVNRPEHEAEFEEGNVDLTARLLRLLAERPVPVMYASSVQATNDSAYGRSKRAGEELVLRYGEQTGAPVYIHRLPNLFGKWARPHYNSVVATFCHQIARGLPVELHEVDAQLRLAYIDDVVDELASLLEGGESGYRTIGETHVVTVGCIYELIQSFRESRETRDVPDMSDSFTKALYSTYLSYLPEESFSYPLLTHADARGSFTEFLRTPERGQVSVNVAKPGVTKGNHWHHTKNEKFLVVSGQGVIRFRKPDARDVLEYAVSGERFEVVDIPVGYAHNIENIGATDLVTIMWANEPFDPERPDTYFLEV